MQETTKKPANLYWSNKDFNKSKVNESSALSFSSVLKCLKIEKDLCHIKMNTLDFFFIWHPVHLKCIILPEQWKNLIRFFFCAPHFYKKGKSNTPTHCPEF